MASAKRRKFTVEFKEKALQYAAETSGEKAAKHFNIDPKRIRDWRKQKYELMSADKKRVRLAGGGRKKVSEELERKLFDWIYTMRDAHTRVSRNMIRKKATEIYPSVSDGHKPFVASNGWLCKFLRRNALTPRRLTAAAAQKDPDLLTDKLVLFIDYVGKAISSKNILEKDVIAMDETAVWFDMVSPTTTDERGTESGSLKTTGYEKSRLTVVLAAMADGTKLKPYVVFKGAVREVRTMRQQISGAVIATSKNGWMNDALTADWLKSVVGKSGVSPRLLVWDSYRCHISAATKAELTAYNVTAAVIPGGCAKYVQAPDVTWNQPFEQSLRDAYDEWLAGDTVKRYTGSGDLVAPDRRLLVDWVLAAWDRLDKELIVMSFKVCGQNVKPDGSEDHLIHCFKEGQPCAAGREALTRLRRRDEENTRQEEHHEEDEEELFNNELVVLHEEDEEELFNSELVVIHDEDDADGEKDIANGEADEDE